MTKLKGIKKSYFGATNKEIESIFIQSPISKNGVNIQVEEIDLKPGWEKRGESKPGKITNSNTKKKIIPLINLDIYGQPVNRIAIGGSLKINSSLDNLGIKVEVPKLFLKKIIKDSNVYNKIEKKPVLYASTCDGWVELKNDPCISNFDDTGDPITFIIDRWPADDRMVGCGG